MTFGIVDTLDVPVLLGTTFIDRAVTSIHSSKRKTVSHHFLSVPIVMVYEARSTAENVKSNNFKENEKDLEVFVARTLSDHKNITVARQVVLNAMCETPVLVSTKVATLIQRVLHEILAKNHA